jgi:MFS family permease
MRWYLVNTTLLGVAGLGLAWAPTLAVALGWAIPLGIGGAGFITGANALSQQESPPAMRGRLLALTAVAFLGSTPIGGPITGVIGDRVGAEWALAYGSVITLVTVTVAAIAVSAGPDRTDDAEPVVSPAA